MKDKDTFIKILLIFFSIFLVMYLTHESGYYAFKANQKMNLTNESIQKFESDISSGKDITIEDYVIDNYQDYSNVVSNTGYWVGNNIEKIMNEGIKKTLKTLSALFYE